MIYKNIEDNSLVFMADISKYATLEVMYSENVLNALSIIITIVSIIATVSIGVVTLLLSRTNIKLSDYLKLVTKKDGSFLLICVIFLNTITSLFIIYQPYTILIDIWLKIGIVPPIVFFIILIKNFEIIDKEEKMKEYLLFLLDNKKKDLIDFLLNITLKSFDKEFYPILNYIMKETKTTDKKYLFAINEEIIKKIDIEIDYILNIQSIIIPSADEQSFVELQEKYLDISFSNYIKMIFRNNSKYNNFILRVKSHLYINVLYNEGLNPDQEKNLLRNYLNLMRRSYELVIIILRKNNIENTREAINDFLGLVQFFSINKMVNRNPDMNIDSRYNYYLVGMVCWILNRIIIINLNIDEYPDIISILLKRISEIVLSGLETDMFDELITDIDFHKIRYTRTFFIALSLIFLEESDVVETLEKIYYDKTRGNNHFLFQQIIEVYGDVTAKEKQALNLSRENFDNKANNIIKIIAAKKSSVIRQQNNIIANTPIRPEILEREKENIEKELSFLVSDNHGNFTEDRKRFLTSMPRRFLIGDSSAIVIGMNVYKINVILFFYKNYIANYDSIKISKVSEITSENTTLIMPSHLIDYIFQHTDYNYKGDGIEIEGKYYPVIWIQEQGPILTLKDLLDFIHLPQNSVTIEQGEDENKDDELYTKCEVTIKYYKCNNPNKRIGYSIL
jgi:hypothetical protein